MLESIPTQIYSNKVFRFGTQVLLTEFLETQDLDGQGMREVRMLLPSWLSGDTPDELCDAPFRKKPSSGKLGSRSRFSDGSFPVFYSSLDPKTAEAEIRHLVPKIVGKPPKQRTFYYSRFGCDFNGRTKDLRSKAKQWPKLLHDSDYGFCNRLGFEAKKLDLDGVLTPSVRRLAGTNLPVFTRKSISNPRDSVDLAVTYDPATDSVSIAKI